MQSLFHVWYTCITIVGVFLVAPDFFFPPGGTKDCIADAVIGRKLSQKTSLAGLAGLVVKASASRAKIPGSNPACAGIFSGSSHTSDLKIGTPVATLPDAWRYRVSAGTGWPGVSIL